MSPLSAAKSSCEEGSKLLRLAYSSTLKMEAIFFSETSLDFGRTDGPHDAVSPEAGTVS
jgi:hypothetical protein